MAFNRKFFAKWSSGGMYGAANNVWSYGSSTDDLQTISASGYFNDAKDMLQQYDYIFVNGSDGQTEYIVSSASGASPVTLSFPSQDAVDVDAYSSKWTSTVKVRLISPSVVLMSGTATSTANNNTDPAITFPTGYVPDFGFSKSVSISRSGSAYQISAGQVSWSGSGATLDHPDARAFEDDKVMATYNTLPSESGILSAKVTVDGTITFTQSAANTSNDSVIDYIVFKDQLITTADLGTSGSVAGITPVMNINDFIYMNVVYSI